MRPEEIPLELVAIVNEAAGREHSADGIVLQTLANVLTRYDELIERRLRELAFGVGNRPMEPARMDEPRSELPAWEEATDEECDPNTPRGRGEHGGD